MKKFLSMILVVLMAMTAFAGFALAEADSDWAKIS